ncbi:DivIVA domain-containing protein [Dietzia alimentaria]|uniref:DivIVA domain-containing protein n=1 Tax=Dietzia alimentaria TaxID=665550 RepID=UPI00029A8805|nr:DivIVA domain-containing protein [Dietzia alimentaria]
MLTVIVYVVVTLVVAAALFALSVVVFGRSEVLPTVATGHTVTHLPEGPLAGEDLREVRFGMSARGYTMSEVDWTLEHAAAEIDRLRARLEEAGIEPGASHGLDVGPAPASHAASTR